MAARDCLCDWVTRYHTFNCFTQNGCFIQEQTVLKYYFNFKGYREYGFLSHRREREVTSGRFRRSAHYLHGMSRYSRWRGDRGPSRPLGPMHSVTLSPPLATPLLVPVNTSPEKRKYVVARGRVSYKYEPQH